MNDVKMTSDAAQQPNFLVSVGMDLHPVVVRLQLAGPLCNGGKLARCALVAGFCTIPLNILCGLSSCNKAFFLLQGNQSHELCIHDLRWLKEKKKEWSISVTRVRLRKKQKKRFEFDIYELTAWCLDAIHSSCCWSWLSALSKIWQRTEKICYIRERHGITLTPCYVRVQNSVMLTPWHLFRALAFLCTRTLCIPDLQ